jgi:hypothetical protein
MMSIRTSRRLLRLRFDLNVNGVHNGAEAEPGLGWPAIPRDQLIHELVEIAANKCRLGSDGQNFIARALHQRRTPSRRHCSLDVSGMASHHEQLRRK